MNKNDLRFQKTEMLIKKTYLTLKKRGSSVVKVKDLCEKAMINKTTFYAHYETIDHLHKQVCEEFVKEILSKCEDINKIQSETRAFVFSILGIFMENIKMVEKLYGEDLFDLVNDVERVLMEYFIKENREEDFSLAVRFCIGGAFRLLVLERDPESVQKTVELIERVINP